MRNLSTIAKREFRANFDSPVAYVVICSGCLLLGFFFFFLNGGFWQADRASLERLLLHAPLGLSLLVVPAVTMRLLAEERRSGTIEMLVTLPVRDREIVLGKFLGAWGLVLILIATTLLYPLVMFRFPWHLGSLDVGPLQAGYLGLVLYSLAAVAIGLLVSCLAESQLVAFVVTLMVLLALHAVGLAADKVSNDTLRSAIEFVSFDVRLAPFTRGMVDTRGVVYFVSITIGCLTAAFHAIERRKWI